MVSVDGFTSSMSDSSRVIRVKDGENSSEADMDREV